MCVQKGRTETARLGVSKIQLEIVFERIKISGTLSFVCLSCMCSHNPTIIVACTLLKEKRKLFTGS